MNSEAKTASLDLCRLQRFDASATEISGQLHYFSNLLTDLLMKDNLALNN